MDQTITANDFRELLKHEELPPAVMTMPIFFVSPPMDEEGADEWMKEDRV